MNSPATMLPDGVIIKNTNDMNPLKSNFFLFVFCAIGYNLPAQIQLTSSDFIKKGHFSMALDTGFDPGPSGSAQNWDFQKLLPRTTFGYTINRYTGKGNGNSANLVKLDGTDTFGYYFLDSLNIFEVIPLQNFDETDYRNLKTMSLPFKYNETQVDSFDIEHRYAGVVFGLASYDSLLVRFKMIRRVTADAWGQLKIPSFDVPALRIWNETISTLRMFGKKGVQSYVLLPAFNQDDTERLYQWYAKYIGCALATYHMDTRQMEYMQSQQLDAAAIPNENIVIPNPFAEALMLTNKGESIYNIVICDMLGRVLIDTGLKNDQMLRINTSDWAGGYYVLKVSNVFNGNLFLRKILKE